MCVWEGVGETSFRPVRYTLGSCDSTTPFAVEPSYFGLKRRTLVQGTTEDNVVPLGPGSMSGGATKKIVHPLQSCSVGTKFPAFTVKGGCCGNALLQKNNSEQKVCFFF